MVRENSNTTPYLTNEIKDIFVNSLCGIIIIVFTFCGHFIMYENSGNTTIRENTGIMTSQLIIIMIENLLILLFVRIVVLFIIILLINILMSLDKTKQIILYYLSILRVI